MSTDRICDVLIIGAGATGSLAAMVLSRAGLDVVCLEQGSWVEARITFTCTPTGHGSGARTGIRT